VREGGDRVSPIPFEWLMDSVFFLISKTTYLMLYAVCQDRTKKISMIGPIVM
jgi:hypothetical protein